MSQYRGIRPLDTKQPHNFGNTMSQIEEVYGRSGGLTEMNLLSLLTCNLCTSVAKIVRIIYAQCFEQSNSKIYTVNIIVTHFSGICKCEGLNLF